MKYEVCFAMCHSETVEIELEAEDVEGKEEGEIEALVERLAWRKIRCECTDWEADEIIEIGKVKGD